MGIMNFFEDAMEMIGPDTPLLNSDEENRRKDKRRGRPNSVHQGFSDFFHTIGPDGAFMGGEYNNERNKSTDRGRRKLR